MVAALSAIGNKDSVAPSSDLNTTFLLDFLQEFQSYHQTTPLAQRSGRLLEPHLNIKIPVFFFLQILANQNEQVCQNHSSSKSLLSNPLKKPMMSQSFSFSRFPSLSSIGKLNQGGLPVTSIVHKKEPLLNSNPSHTSLCFTSFPVLLATKRITLKLIHHSYPASVFRIHLKLKLFLLFFVSSVYIFTSTHLWTFLFLYTVSFFAILVILLNLVVHRFPPARVIFGRCLCNKLWCSKSPPQNHARVVWSIGSKPKPKPRPISGSWVHVYSNRDVYEGEFHKGKCSGSGVYYYHMSGRYEGDWIDEKYDGYGVETWAKGSRYRGQYRLGMRHGVGMYRSHMGDVYSGEWSNGQCHGYGVHSCEDGSSYVGQFKWGAKHGLGHYHFRNGDTYAGQYFADKMHGFGVYHFGNGHRYEGAWHEGRRQGFGTYTFRNGDTQAGQWQNGILSVSSPLDSKSASSLTVDHTKVLHAVQEARRAAKEVVELTDMDARVKRAVAAANKAATAARVAAVKAVQNQMHESISNHNVPSP